MNAKRHVGILATIFFIPVVALGQTQRSGDTNARVAQQLQQLTGERTLLKAENDKLKLELEGLKKEVSATKSEQQSLQKRLQAAEGMTAKESAVTQQNEAEKERLRTQMQELVVRFRETGQTLKEVEIDRNTARSELQARDRELAMCADRNAAFYNLNVEVLERFENKGVFSALTEKEPFTRLQRTRLENLADGYQDRAAELKLETKK